MRKIYVAALVAVASLALASSAFADVQVSLHDGLVTIVAKDATVRQILAEWARVGQTTVMNLDRVNGGPLTLEMRDVPEQQALDVLLRSTAGYMAAARQAPSRNASTLDRIIVMPVSAALGASAPASAAIARGPVNQPADDDTDDDEPQPAVVVPPAQRSIFATFPQPQVVNPQSAPATAPGVVRQPTPTFAVGGAVVQPPQGVPGEPNEPGAPNGAAPATQPAASPTGGANAPGVIVQPPQQPGNQLQRLVPQPRANDD